MFFDNPIIVTEISIFNPEFTKKKSVFVPARNCHALSFRTAGVVTLETEDRKLISRPGDISFMPAGLSYNTEIRESGRMLVVHFNTVNKHENVLHEVITPTHPLMFGNMFSELFERFKLGRENDLYCMSMFYGILAETRHEMMKKLPDRAANPRMRTAKEHIERGFDDISLSVKLLAEEAGISEVYFRREFNQCFGMSPGAYIKKIRIENAKAYLRTGYYSVTETAIRCGFDSISYFSYEFHRIVGCTPKEYAARFE